MCNGVGGAEGDDDPDEGETEDDAHEREGRPPSPGISSPAKSREAATPSVSPSKRTTTTPSVSPTKRKRRFAVACTNGCLPHADALLAVMRKASEGSSTHVFGVPSAGKLLEAHPSYAQSLAKNDDLRRIIESGAEAIVGPATRASSGKSGPAHVLWTICGCVWKAIGLVVSGMCARLPPGTSPLDAQMRHLMESNDDLRTRLALCRHDYLRELTQLRERCRQLEPPVAEALAALLREEPVMFFEPMDFVFDDITKDFIRITVEEKLRLLMLKGWRKGADEELEALSRRVQELEAENLALRSRHASYTIAGHLLPLGVDDVEEACEVGHDRRFPDGLGSSGSREEDDVDRELADVLHSQATQTGADAGGDTCGFSRRTIGRMGSRHAGSAIDAATSGGALSTTKIPNSGNAVDSIGACASANSELESLQGVHRQLEQKYSLLQQKFAHFVQQMKGSVDNEALEKTLAEVGVGKPRQRPRKAGGAFDRLYADAQARLQRLRERNDEVHSMQAAELRKCSDAARGKGDRKKVEQLKGLHSKTVVCANAFHEALETFHMDVARTASGEAGEDDENGQQLGGKMPQSPTKQNQSAEAQSQRASKLREMITETREPPLGNMGVALSEQVSYDAVSQTGSKPPISIGKPPFGSSVQGEATCAADTSKASSSVFEVLTPRRRAAIAVQHHVLQHTPPAQNEQSTSCAGCKSQGASPSKPQVQRLSKASHTSQSNSVRLSDSGWRSAFGESPPKRVTSGETLEAPNGPALIEAQWAASKNPSGLPREIQVLAERLRHDQRFKGKTFSAENVAPSTGASSMSGSNRVSTGGAARAAVLTNSSSLPSLPHALRGTRLTNNRRSSPRSPRAQRPASTPSGLLMWE